MSEKEVKALQDEEIEGVAGGYVNWIGNVCCDVCRKKIGSTSGIYLKKIGQYICNNCLAKSKQALGPNALDEYIKVNS